ncbi:hypothetical protein STA3757_30500 [Stanieria sp. NIES-3757]|nr:hypothetical protein STA3757_30500 [Stanieria sp. NIES-3757]
MSICVDLIQPNNPENWQLRTTAIKQAETTGENSHVPMDSFDLGLDFTSFFLLAEVTANYRKSTWKYGGTLSPLYYVDTDKIFNRGFSLRIRRTKLIIIENPVAIPYKLQFDPPSWFKDLTLRVWEYVGEINNEIRERLISVEDKIDQLL